MHVFLLYKKVVGRVPTKISSENPYSILGYFNSFSVNVPLRYFYVPMFHERNSGLLMFSGGIEVKHIGLKCVNDTVSNLSPTLIRHDNMNCKTDV